MKKRYLILAFLILICSISFVSASDDISAANDTVTLDDGQALSDMDDKGPETNDETSNDENEGNDETPPENESSLTIQLDNITEYKSSDNFEFKILNGSEPVYNATASYSFGLGSDYDAAPTDESGAGYFNIGLSEIGNYTVTVSYEGISASKLINVIGDSAAEDNSSSNSTDVNSTGNNKTGGSSTKNVIAVAKKVTTKNIVASYGTKAKYTVKVLDKSGKVISGKKVTIRIGKNSYNAYTNSKGIAAFALNYSAGSYSIRYHVDKISGSNTYKVKNAVTFTILKWGLKGDVAKAKLIKKSMPNNVWVKKAVAATKKGIPLLKFTGGKGKIVFITAGVHGNELSSQVAAMRMINYLSNHPIKGTVYIMPFVNVKAISKKVRYTDKDFNRIAAKSGTVSNNIVKLISKYKCNAYGDFHTTKPGGAPGQNIVMGSKSPTKSSAALTKYISKNCKVNKRIYSYAGQQYPGALADNVNMHGIPAVICEVVLPHNTLTAKSIKISYNMMTHLLKFNSII